MQDFVKVYGLYLIVALLVGFFVGFSIYLGSGLSSGLPFGFLVGLLPPFNVADKSLHISVEPKTPTNVGESIVVTVRDNLDGPAQYANVTITHESFIYTTLTDEKGQTEKMEFLGPVTYVVAQKQGFRGDYVILGIPDVWNEVKAKASSDGVVGGIVGAAATVLIQRFISQKKSGRGNARKR